jgi:predicted NBD/HSP70 family sugar kinase
LKKIYALIHKHRIVSKTDLLRLSGMTTSTLTRTLTDLSEQGFIQEVGLGESTGGRKPILYQIHPDYAYVFGLEISRSVSKLILFDLRLSVLDSVLWRMTEEMTPDRLLEEVKQAVHRMMQRQHLSNDRILGIGIGAVGPLDRKKGIILDPLYFPSDGWRNIEICRRLEDGLDVQVNLDNGANASLLGEYWAENTHEFEHYLYLHAGVGIRSALMAGGKTVYGAIELEGSIGQMIIQTDGAAPREKGQNYGCLESYASIYALERNARSMLKQGRNSLLGSLVDDIEQIRFAHLLKALREHDPLAEQLFTQAATFFGIGISNVLNIFHPEKVILGGPLITTNELFYETAKRVALQKTYYYPQYQPEFCKSRLGEDSIAYGAALMMIRQLTE